MSSEEPDLPVSDDPHRATFATPAPQPPRRRWGRILGLLLLILAILAAGAWIFGRIYFGRAMRANLPQLDGSQVVYGLAAPVTVTRDAHGVPHINAASMDDLIFAQGYITAQDRLWQMELMRREAAGELAAVMGRTVLQHDVMERALQLRAAADRAVAALPADQKHWLAVYARGVNASIVAQHSHLPVEFRLLGYSPAAWTPRDSILVELAMYQELTNEFSTKLVREQLTAHLPADLIADLYPVGSWRDHVPGAQAPDLSAPQAASAPLDESQSRVVPPVNLLPLEQTQAIFNPRCASCVAGSNGWAVAGSRTASGKPLLSNDMHLNLMVPGTWYEADLQAALPPPLAAFHVAGVTLPGVPFVVVGHNDHVAWGFTNLGADVQDLYIEHTRGTPSGAQYQTATGEWLPMKYSRETIHVRSNKDVVIDIPLTHHGDVDTPVISALMPGETRSLSLRWSVYDPAALAVPLFAINSAGDWASMLSAFSTWGPPLNMMYADDQGHIGYHAVGKIPVRGDINNPGALAPVPTDVAASDASMHEWAGYIPFDQLPQSLDPTDGVLATANSRVTPDGYRYPITLDWMAPYRTERIYKVLESSPARTAEGAVSGNGHLLTSSDMLALQTDVYSELDQEIAHRLAYAIDHATGPLKGDAELHQAADLLRSWNGSVDATAAAPAIVNASRDAFWPLLLIPRLLPQVADQLAHGADMSKLKLPSDQAALGNLGQQYTWGERGYVEEQLLSSTPARWLPKGYATWDDFLAAVVKRGLANAKAPRNLGSWQQGEASPVDIEHPLFSHFLLAQMLLGVPTGTGPQPKSGDETTVKQISRSFGPSERFTADLSNLDNTTLNIVLGQSGNPASPWFMDQFQDWLNGRTYTLPFSTAATQPTITHTLTLNPR
ncbi:MAG TPA: penicillin acylase family protein [Acidobacteriaceae bacterium]|nr:penicillin acylase family protein [Acidobacteriaceae bacterium]